MILCFMGALLVVILVLILYFFYRESVWDHIMALNVITNLVVLLILLFAVYFASSLYVDAAIVYALLSFVGSLFIVVYVYRKGDI